MRGRISRASVLFSLLPAIGAANTGLIQVTGIRSWSHGNTTRVILQTTGPFEYHSDRAVNPDRLFFDLPHSRPWIAGHRYKTEIVADHLVRRVRIAETAPGTTRVVFDLTGPHQFTVAKLEAPDRMVIEIHGSGGSPAQTPVMTSSVSLLPQPPLPLRGLSPAAANRRGSYRRRVVAFVYPPEPARPMLHRPVLAGLPPSMDVQPLTPPELPDSTILLATAKAPRKILIDRTNPAAIAATTKVLPATPVPYERPLAHEAAPKPSENAAQSLTRALGLKVNRIVIDAGHGGHDDGTIGPDGVLEKDVVLDVALRLSKLAQTRMGVEVVLTRSDDTFIPLQERTAIANRHKADLFLSIHANSSPAPSVAGTETFFLNVTSSPGAIDVAARENAGSDRSVGELKDLIQSITLNDKIAESQSFAQTIQNSMFAQAAKSNIAARNRGVKRAPFVVLIGASMPSVLAEIGFLTNSRDESNLGKPEYRQKVAESLLKGLMQYSQSLSHFEMAGKIDRTERGAVGGAN